jgi:T5orf172 domain
VTRRSRQKPPGGAVVYFAQDDTHAAKPIKIGTTTRWCAERLAEIKTPSGEAPKLLCWVPGHLHTERQLHAEFKSNAMPEWNEWFLPAPELLKLIDGVLAGIARGKAIRARREVEALRREREEVERSWTPEAKATLAEQAKVIAAIFAPSTLPDGEIPMIPRRRQ